jgi:hypothetical protein
MRTLTAGSKIYHRESPAQSLMSALLAMPTPFDRPCVIFDCLIMNDTQRDFGLRIKHRERGRKLHLSRTVSSPSSETFHTRVFSCLATKSALGREAYDLQGSYASRAGTCHDLRSDAGTSRG